MKKQLNDIITSSSYMRHKPFFFKGFSLSDYKSSKTIIMWDFENTNVPTYCRPSYLFTNIKNSLRNLGYTGEIVMRGYGDVQYLQDKNKLVESGIHITHVDSGKDAGDKRLLNSIHSWAYDNPPPCNMLFITSDGDFATATFIFKTCGYNTMVAHQSTKVTESKKTHTI
ncbi:PREDICTED: uncharacterized protein LOC104791300 [Camelina sativa]|uniref:Uncharacterized protein LOC104791300 n=1 Tax=Camelina sativa TaxID=90675 RepID=A0ABM0ZGL3_CAMSA|nr:PREDICTED: uncharacterized protein LOC104791300 [Camelina sativa]